MPNVPARPGAGQPVPSFTLGGQEHQLRSFKAFKGAHVAAIVAGITDEAKEVSTRYRAFAADYRNTNTVRVPESVAQLRGWTVEDRLWKMDDSNGERYLELPASVPEELQILEVFEDAYAIAKVHVVRLLALILVDDEKLAEAEDQSPEHVDALLDSEGKLLMRAAETWEIVDLLDAARELVARELTARAEKVGKLRRLGTTRTSEPPPQAEPQAPELTPTTASPTSETPTGTSDGSSTSSPPPTDGDGATSSTASPTETPSSSSAGPSEPAAAR
jgi:hypothetical protein